MSQRIILLVEGHTEHKSIAEFLKIWLDPKLAAPVGVIPVRFDGWSALVRDAGQRAHFYLDEAPKRHEVIAVVGLLDLYGPTFYPDEPLTLSEKYDWGKKHIERIVDHPRFHQHFAVHETEAWLLSDPSRFPTEVRAAFGSAVAAPENINSIEPPAKFLDRIYMSKTKKHYKKVTEAQNRFPNLDPELATTKCPFLKMMLEDILDLVQTARQ